MSSKRTGSRGRGRGISLRTLMRHEMNGVKFTPSPQPPIITEHPWNTMTLQIGGVGDAVLTGTSVAPLLQAQAGLGSVTGLTFDFRVHRVRVWSLTKSKPIRLQIYAFDNTSLPTGGCLASIDSWPDQIHYARCGYELPKFAQLTVWSSDSTEKFASVDVGKASAWMGFLDVLWKGNVYTPLTSTVRYQYMAPRDDESLSSSIVNLQNS